VSPPHAIRVVNVPSEFADVASAPRASRKRCRKGYFRCTVSARKVRPISGGCPLCGDAQHSIPCRRHSRRLTAPAKSKRIPAMQR